jgi:hypothetical protein
MNIADMLASDSMTVGEQMMTSGHQRTNYEVEVVSKTAFPHLKPAISSSQRIAADWYPGYCSRHQHTPQNGGGTARRTSGLCLVRTVAGEDFRIGSSAGNGPRLAAIFVAFAISPESQFLAMAFVSLYDPIQDIRTACYAWGDGEGSRFLSCR